MKNRATHVSTGARVGAPADARVEGSVRRHAGLKVRAPPRASVSRRLRVSLVTRADFEIVH